MKVLFLLDSDAGSGEISIERLEEMFEGIEEAGCLAGSFDAYVKADVQDEVDLERVQNNIREIRWVNDTETNVILPENSSL